MRRFGYGKGAIGRAVEEAVPLRNSPVGARDLWGPVEAVSGVLADMARWYSTRPRYPSRPAPYSRPTDTSTA